ncbi:MAG: hypothetical protein WDN47_05000 [Candidatus Doudnabacteria bacterium]
MQTIKKIAVLAAAAGLLASPLFALAVDTSVNVSGNANVNVGANFCSRINSTSSTLNNLVAKLQNNRGKFRSQMLQSLSNRITSRASSVAKIRASAKGNFAADIAKLNAKATTDAQKAAVASFQVSVQAAQTTRQQAIQAAISAYMTAVQQEITNRENTVQTAATTFQSAVTAALAKAKSDCASKVDSPTARATFAASISSANTTFKASVTGLATGQLIALAQTRDNAIQAANQAFRASLQQAVVTLKAAFATP